MRYPNTQLFIANMGRAWFDFLTARARRARGRGELLVAKRDDSDESDALGVALRSVQA